MRYQSKDPEGLFSGRDKIKFYIIINISLNKYLIMTLTDLKLACIEYVSHLPERIFTKTVTRGWIITEPFQKEKPLFQDP